MKVIDIKNLPVDTSGNLSESVNDDDDEESSAEEDDVNINFSRNIVKDVTIKNGNIYYLTYIIKIIRYI